MTACARCDGSGLVAPSAFAGEEVAWPAWLAKAAGVEAAGGYPPSASATRAGLIRPVACPECSDPLGACPADRSEATTRGEVSSGQADVRAG